MLNDDEKKELKLYKSRLKAIIGGFLLFFILSLFMVAAFGHFSTSITLVIVLLFFIISVIIEFLLAMKDYLSYSRMLGFFLLWFSMTFFIFIGSFYVGNTYLIKWQLMPNIVMYSMALLLFFFSIIYYLRKRDFIDEAVKEGKLNLEEKIYYVFQEGHSEVIKQSGRVGTRMGFLAALTPGIGVAIIFVLGFDVNAVDTKQIIRGVGMLIGLYFVIPRTASELARAIQFYQYGKINSELIYTGLIKYIRLEDEINLWRKERGLKPVKIKSLFFFGDIDK